MYASPVASNELFRNGKILSQRVGIFRVVERRSKQHSWYSTLLHVHNTDVTVETPFTTEWIHRASQYSIGFTVKTCMHLYVTPYIRNNDCNWEYASVNLGRYLDTISGEGGVPTDICRLGKWGDRNILVQAPIYNDVRAPFVHRCTWPCAVYFRA